MAPDAGASSISVAIRVRPFTIREAAQLIKNDDGTIFLGDGSLAAAPTPKLNQKGLRSVIKVVDDRCLVFDPPEDNPVQKFSRSVVPAAGKRVKDQVFAFDRIFDDNASQMDVYEGTTKGLLDSVLDGYNATVFAYGATGCGKTHTITGTAQQPGIIFLTMQELFEKIAERSDEKHTELSLSYLEIYNETIRDLLVPGGSKQGLMLREDTNQAVTVAGLTSHHPRDVQEVMDMIVQGNEYRTVSPTEANAVSSRSHAVLQINVAQRDRNAGANEPHTMATLSIIDLAGSERASATKNRGERLLEGANINKSLLALGGCINALCDPRKRNHVPYRNSKLTRLLKFSLGGNCKTVMIVCVSPSSAHFDETQNTLRYANRAKNIQTKVTRNVFNVNRHVKDFLVKIDEQMALINDLRAQQRDAEHTFGLKVRKQLDKRHAVARDGIQRIRLAYEHALPDRQHKVADMKKLRAIERRLATLSAWAAAFDVAEHASEHPTTADNAQDEDGGNAGSHLSVELPPALSAMRKVARGIMAELEHSRHHLHQKIERSTWDRPLDSALQHSIAQVSAAASDCVAADASEAIAGLTRETELLKANFAREAYLEVLEQEKTTAALGDTAMIQALIAAQFDILASLSATLQMPRDEAVAHGQRVIRRLIDAGVAAACQIVKPDPATSATALSSSGRFSLSTTSDAFPSWKRGTPRRRRSQGLGGLHHGSGHGSSVGTFSSSHSSRTSIGSATNARLSQHLMSPPAKSSPRRRKVTSGTTRGRVSFTPAKKRLSSVSSVSSRESTSASSFKRSVRWRDDETEEGTLADFEKTPQKFAEPPSPAKHEHISVVVEAPEEEAHEEQAHGVVVAAAATLMEPRTVETTGGVRSTMETVPEEMSSPPSPDLPPMTLPAYLSRTDLLDTTDEDNDSSLNDSRAAASSLPSTAPSISAAKPSRFQAGFLSKTRPSQGPGGSVSSPDSESTPQAPQPLSGPSALRKSTPLRNISLPRVSNQQLTPPSATRIASLSGSPKPTYHPTSITSPDENDLPSATTGKSQLPLTRLRSPSPRLSLNSAGNSDSEATTTLDLSSSMDALKLRSAIQSAKKSAMTPTTANNGSVLGHVAGARRFSVAGASHHGHHGHHHHRVSASYSGPGGAALASSTNGISRQRRRSIERRRSPPIACSPLIKDGAFGNSMGSGSNGSGSGSSNASGSGVGRAFTPGQARRMNMGGSLRLDGGSVSGSSQAAGSPPERGRDRLVAALEPPSVKGARRVTIGTAAAGALIGGKKEGALAGRPAGAWR